MRDAKARSGAVAGGFNGQADIVPFSLRSPLEDCVELGIIAEGDMHNSAQADGRERLTALKAVEARLRRLGGLAFAADSKDRIAFGNLIDSSPALFPFWPSYLPVISSPNVNGDRFGF